MDILRVLLIVIEVATSVMLIGLILLQKSSSQGMGLAFGAGMGEALFGSRTGNVLTRATVILSCVFLATTLLLAIVFTSSHERSIIDERTGDMPVQQAAPAPAPSGQGAAPVAAAPAGPATTLLPGQGMDDAENTAPAPAPAAAPVEVPAAAPAASTEPAPQ
ncbi:MAG: preprotein translocase subunit SecG [bacterium]